MPDTLHSMSLTDRRPQLVQVLLALTVLTGFVDAFSYLALGKVFVANMTGNIVFLGFAWAGDGELSAQASLLALGGFLIGALAGGRLARARPGHRGKLLGTALVLALIPLAAALVVSVVAADPSHGTTRFALVVLLALAMGLQNATARALAVPDATTTVLTLTLTGLAADSRLAGGEAPRTGRRVASVLAMLAGAFLGAVLALHADPAWALVAATALSLGGAAVILRLANHSEASAWEAPAGPMPTKP